MPSKSMRKCNDIGCSELTHDSYCDKHKKEIHREFKKYRTDNKEQDFYRSSSWVKLRNHKRMIDPLCEHCLAIDELRPVVIGIISLRSKMIFR